ncbi:MAG: DUF4349 domain-containing protein [Actinomycetales bacterium]
MASLVALVALVASCSSSSGSSSGTSSGASGVSAPDVAADSGGNAASGGGFAGPAMGVDESAGKASTGAGSSGSDGSGSSSSSSSSGSSGSSDGSGSGDTVVPGANRAVIRTASLTLQVRDVPAAMRQVEQIASAAYGFVSDEQGSGDTPSSRKDSASSSGSGSDDSQASVTLQVPGERFESVITDLGALGKRLSVRRSERDVTGQVADLDSRLATMQASVARVRALLAKATTVGEIVNVEGELTKREAELESMQAQRKALGSQVDYATISVALFGPAAAPPVEKPEPTGFLGGLQRGWDAFVSMTVVLLTALGAVLPFAIVLVPLAFLGRWLLRLQRRRLQSTAHTETAGTAT